MDNGRREPTTDHVDVLIVGAGLSGIGAACHLTNSCPSKTYAILESRDAIGGTWDLFRYPGIRSDSDVYTLGYSFRPWPSDRSLADGPSILKYVKDTARDYDVEPHIRFGHKVVAAEWSTDTAHWTVTAQRTHTGDTTEITCNFLFLSTGYYDYDEPYTPHFEGIDSFRGPVIHPQHWSEDIDYEDKRVVVIGSGSTAITLVPAMAQRARHVTMLQRSPTYVISLAGRDPLATKLNHLLPAKASYAVIRTKNVLLQLVSYQLSRRYPKQARALVQGLIQKQVPEADVATHFNPPYNPWDQRLCVAADGDLFQAIRAAKASVVTATIKRFTETGIQLETGEELEADLIVTATGLNLRPVGGMQLKVDGIDVELPKTMGYKGMMLSDVPNLAMALGYTNASWTLKCDLTCAYVCRVLNHMDSHGFDICVPRRDPAVAERPFIDLTSGYIQRSLDKLPKQGERPPWRLYQNYFRDILTLRLGTLEDGAMQFSSARVRAATAQQPHQRRQLEHV